MFLNPNLIKRLPPLTLKSLLPLAAPPPHTLTIIKPFTTTASPSKMAQRPDFKTAEASRPGWDTTSTFHYTKAPNPDWQLGAGANALHGAQDKKHVPIDPYGAGRPAPFNYKLLISAITPRPIAFLSTRSPDGSATNLAPFSYFNLLGHDPPLFAVGFSSGQGVKDTLRNLKESGECVINIISEGFVEAANSTSVNAPYGESEWTVSGLTPVYDCEEVKCARVKEAVFSVEAKLDMVKDYESRAVKGKQSGSVVILEGVRFWAREDAINEEKNVVDPAVLRPVSRLGGITYGRTTQVMELPRPDFQKDFGGEEGFAKLKQEKGLPN